ncbi:hypothetical protein QQG55_8980 [Brugia pahangi]
MRNSASNMCKFLRLVSEKSRKCMIGMNVNNHFAKKKGKKAFNYASDSNYSNKFVLAGIASVANILNGSHNHQERSRVKR